MTTLYEGLVHRREAVEQFTPHPDGVFRLLVTGSRFQRNEEIVWNPLWWMVHKHHNLVIRHGASYLTHPDEGVDLAAHEWIGLPGQKWNTSPNSDYLVIEDAVPADFKTLGRKAGPLRNQDMVSRGNDACFAFPDDRPRSGTLDCLARAWAQGMPCYVFSSTQVGRFHTLSEDEGMNLARRMLGWGS